MCHLHYSQQTFSVKVQIVNMLGILDIGFSPQLLKNVKTILSSSTVQNKQQDPIGDKLLQIYTRSLIKDLSGSNYVRTRNWK